MEPGLTATVAVRVQPRARKNELVGVREGVLIVRVQAPPVDGRANDAVCRLIADRLGVRAATVSLVRGDRSRDKLLRIEGLPQPTVDAALGLR